MVSVGILFWKNHHSREGIYVWALKEVSVFTVTSVVESVPLRGVSQLQ